jgi:UDP-N-acetylmuramoyl-tripeptide--D-alanyl-D-alanine ligase
MSQGISKIISYGTTDGNVTGKALSNSTFLQVQLTNAEKPAIIQTQLVGDYNLPNVLCAVTVGKYFGVPLEQIIQAIENYVSGNSRSQMVVKGSNNFIMDAYNANPSSMKVAIENMAKIDADIKVLMLGGMMELGEESLHEHQNIIDIVRNYAWDKVVLVGGDYGRIIQPYIYFNNAVEAGKWFKEQHFKNAYILIKGSRSMQMEKILEEAV